MRDSHFVISWMKRNGQPFVDIRAHIETRRNAVNFRLTEDEFEEFMHNCVGYLAREAKLTTRP